MAGIEYTLRRNVTGSHSVAACILLFSVTDRLLHHIELSTDADVHQLFVVDICYIAVSSLSSTAVLSCLLF